MPTTIVRTARRMMQAALDDGVTPYAVASSTTSTFVSNQLINGATLADNTALSGRWAYTSYGSLPAPTGAGQQRSVRKPNGYTPSTGTVTIDPAWVAPAAGVEVELTGQFPCYPQVGHDTSYLALLNMAADHILIEDHIEVVSTETSSRPTKEYLLSNQAWLDRPERILGVLDPPRAGGEPRRPTWRRWEPKFDNGFCWISFLDSAYPAGYTFQVKVLRPASSWINGAEAAGVLTLDTDSVNLPVQDWVDVALVYAYRALTIRSQGRPSSPNWLTLWQAQMKIAEGVKGYDGGAPAPTAQMLAEAA